MFEKILLPLDGSQLAEVVIPYVELLAGRLSSEVILLHVCPSEHRTYRHMHQIYLNGLANTMQQQMGKGQPKGGEPRVKAEILDGVPAEVICEYVQKNAISMIAMATRGASGIKVWLLGSVVDKVLRAVNIPTLLVRAKDGAPVGGKERVIRGILLPLDGSDASKISVPYAKELAKKLKASVSLFTMFPGITYATIPLTDTIPYGQAKESSELREAAEKKLRDHLGEVEKELRQEGIHVTSTVKLGMDPAYEILEQEKESKADLMVMATRGESPIARWAFGSVAEKVLREGDLPLLLIREAK